MQQLFWGGFKCASIIGFAIWFSAAPTSFAGASPASQSTPPLLEQIATTAGNQYHGEGLSVRATAGGAQLYCTFQRLAGRATQEGLWLNSTITKASRDGVRIVATAIGRGAAGESFPDLAQLKLSTVGAVTMTADYAQFIRPGLTEEYSVSVAGVRQDFILEPRPVGAGELWVSLEVTGARAEALINGVQLVLNTSGRKLAYHRLHVVDARGQELAARLELADAARLTVRVDDTDAVYPIRIDPTFSDADWVIISGHPGTDNNVSSLAIDGSGNLYVGGSFAAAGNIVASRIAKWDGSAWSTLGSGFNNSVNVLLVNGSTLYAGGLFTTATNTGGAPVSVNHIAAWDGSDWSALGGGITGASTTYVQALAALGGDLYAGGAFDSAGGNPASCIAKWNGSAWSAVGQGVDDVVNALAVSGSDIYVAGRFINATDSGGATVTVNRITKWTGSSWTTLGEGLNNSANTLTFFGGDLHVGGNFLVATNTGGGSVIVGNIARWDGTAWQTLGSGVQSTVTSLAVSDGELFVGGSFTSAGG